MALPRAPLLRLAITTLACCCGCGGRVEADAQLQQAVDASVEATVQDAPVQLDSTPDMHPADDASSTIDLVLFLTDGTWRGAEIGALEGADIRCQMEGKGLGGPFVAVLSAQGISARDRMPAGRLFNAKGALIEQDSSAFFQLRDYKASGIEVDLDAKGTPVHGYNPGEVAWWGSDETGTSDCGTCCANWAGGSNMDSAAAIDPEIGLIGSWPGCLIGNPVRLICVGPRTQ